MKKIKTMVLSLSLILIVCVFSFTISACAKKLTDDEIVQILKTKKGLQPVNVSVEYIYGDDIAKYLAYADYVFVCKVKNYLRTIYNDSDPDMPYTIYAVRIIENIKGELLTDRDIEIRKGGGITSDHKKLVLIGNNIFPEIGSTYVVAAVSYHEGTLGVDGKHSTVFVGSDYKNNESYKEFSSLCETTPSQERERYVSPYDLRSN
ncbi:MAG: hypothetical protein LBU04_04190 [Christensenellaceae bacterium]|jgi:outer membrane lipoprotein-sorting protein|nr:hypothetical protein [Christensenellaceae bacterium]